MIVQDPSELEIVAASGLDLPRIRGDIASGHGRSQRRIDGVQFYSFDFDALDTDTMRPDPPELPLRTAGEPRSHWPMEPENPLLRRMGFLHRRTGRPAENWRGRPWTGMI